SLASPVLTILPEETVLTSAPKNGSGDVSGRPKILQEVVTANSVPEHAEDIAKPSESEEKKPLSLVRMGGDAAEAGASDARASIATAAAPAGSEETVAATPAPGADGRSGQERRHASSDDFKAEAGNGLNHTPYQNGEAEEAALADVLNLDSLSSDPDDEKIGPHLPTLLERLRSIGEDHGEGEKPSPPSRGLG
ncbi:MAG: hypothetical protein WBS14_08185, partial [Rhodomicrobium sp.]